MSVKPYKLGRNVTEDVKKTLKDMVEGTFNEEDGFVIAVTGFYDDVGQGRINPDTGDIEFRVNFKALILKPEDSDVLDVLIQKADEACITCSMGPIEPILLHREQMDEGMEYDPATHTWRHNEDTDEFKDGGKVRLKLTKMDWRMPFGIATVKHNGLGQLPDE